MPEIYLLHCNILERVLRQTDQLRCWFNLQEQRYMYMQSLTPGSVNTLEGILQ